MTAEQFRARLARHDWLWDWADSLADSNRGRAEEADLRAAADRLGPEFGAEFRAAQKAALDRASFRGVSHGS